MLPSWNPEELLKVGKYASIYIYIYIYIYVCVCVCVCVCVWERERESCNTVLLLNWDENSLIGRDTVTGELKNLLIKRELFYPASHD